METIKRLLPYLPLTIVIAAIVYFLWDDFIEWRRDPISPRDENGVHLLYTKDSVYRIRFVIEEAWAKEVDPPEPPGY